MNNIIFGYFSTYGVFSVLASALVWLTSTSSFSTSSFMAGLSIGDLLGLSVALFVVAKIAVNEISELILRQNLRTVNLRTVNLRTVNLTAPSVIYLRQN